MALAYNVTRAVPIMSLLLTLDPSVPASNLDHGSYDRWDKQTQHLSTSMGLSRCPGVLSYRARPPGTREHITYTRFLGGVIQAMDSVCLNNVIGCLRFK